MSKAALSRQFNTHIAQNGTGTHDKPSKFAVSRLKPGVKLKKSHPRPGRESKGRAMPSLWSLRERIQGERESKLSPPGAFRGAWGVSFGPKRYPPEALTYQYRKHAIKQENPHRNAQKSPSSPPCPFKATSAPKTPHIGHISPCPN